MIKKNLRKKKSDLYLVKIQISFEFLKKKTQFSFYKKPLIVISRFSIKKKNYNKQSSKEHAKKILAKYLSMAIIYIKNKTQ